jgi:glucokinase
VPVRIDHNVRAAALAEGRDGVAASVADWLYLSVSHTVVAAAVVAGQLQRGATGAAGELGHLPIHPFGERCTCGQRGCLEAYASTTAVTTRYARVSGRSSSAGALASLIGRDPLADEVWGHAAAALGVALTHYTMLNDPEVIVLAGEIGDLDEAVVGLIRQELRSRLAWRQAPRVASARLSGAQAALTGAAILGWELLS